MSDLTRKRPATSSSNTADSTSSQSKRRKPQILKTKVLNPVNSTTGLSECFHKVKTSLYVSLAPSYLNKPIEGVKAQHLDTLVMKHYHPVNGVIIGYTDVKLSSESEDDADTKILSKVNAHSPFAFLWINVEFLVWKPLVGDIVEGYIYMQSPSHIGLLINDTFNASIKKFNIPSDWTFIPNQIDETIEDEDDGSHDNKKSATSLGQWIDGSELPVEGKLTFTIRAIHTSGRVVSVEGSLLQPGNESDSLPVVPNSTTQVNKRIKFDDDDLPSTAVLSNENELPHYDNNESGDENVVAQASSSDDDDSDSD